MRNFGDPRKLAQFWKNTEKSKHAMRIQCSADIFSRGCSIEVQELKTEDERHKK